MSRADALDHPLAAVRLFWGGDCRGVLAPLEESARRLEQQGSIAGAAVDLAFRSRANGALGNFDDARADLARAEALAERLPEGSNPWVQTISAHVSLAILVDGPAVALDIVRANMATMEESAELSWVGAVSNLAVAAAVAAGTGDADEAVSAIASGLPAIEQAPGHAANYPFGVDRAARALWLVNRTDHAEVIERNAREKVLAPDFRYPEMDGRLIMAWLCALQGRHDEAIDWFAQAREVLEQDGKRPLRAQVDYDEATMYARRAEPGDADRARALLDAATAQFTELGMPGWITLAEELAASRA